MPWKPGQSGNPKGRPAKPDFRTVAESLPEEFKAEFFTDAHGQRVTLEQMAVGAMVIKAGEGDMRAVIELCNRVFGKCVEQVLVENVDKPAGEMTDDELLGRIRGIERAASSA